MTGRLAVPNAVHVPWRALAVAVLVPLIVGVALYEGLLAGKGTLATPVGYVPAISEGGTASVAAAARASISAALGLDIPRYHLTANAGGFSAENAAQHLRIGFTRTGVLLRAAGGQLGLRLRAEGNGSSLRRVGDVEPELERSNRVAYSHDGTTEWYVNGPLGLEQGFSIARAPASAGALTLAVGISGASRVALAADGQSAQLRDAGGAELSYGGLSARDANGRALHAWMTSDGRQLLLHVDARSARFPVVVDPMVEAEPEQKLNAGSEKLSDGSSGQSAEHSRFGWSVALSADGNTALVGAPGEDDGVGAAWTFTRAANGWIQTGAKLTIPEKTLDAESCNEVEDDQDEGEEPDEAESRPCHFGRSVALSADGDTAVVGAPREDGNTGAVWTFTRTGTEWSKGTEQHSPETQTPQRFGTSLALSADGSTLVVGAPRLGGGRVWSFTRSGSSWSSLGGAITGAGDDGVGLFGQSVALSDDGQTMLVGAPNDNDGQGTAWGFSRSGSSWEEHGPKLAGGGPGPEEHFGSSVALSGDGSTAVVGARGADSGDGAASVFANTPTGWVEQQGSPLEGGDEAGEGFGDSVALSFDGSVAVVGAGQADGHRGNTWLFERSGESESESESWGAAQEKLGAGVPGRGALQFGSGVALSADAETVLVGAHSAERAGAAWVFGPSPSVAAVAPNSGPAAGGTTVTITGEHLSGASTVRFGSAYASITVESAKSITVVSPPGAGTVNVTVETPVGVSATNTGDRFTYTGKGGGGGGEEPGGGGGEKHGNKEPTTDAPTTEEVLNATGGLSQFATGSETVVLAFAASAHSTCKVSLLSARIAVQGHARALVKLKALGAGTCRGTLTLKVKLKSAKKRPRSKSIAAVSFSLAAGKLASVKLALNAYGRALLRAGHGHLTANLLVLKSAPTPAQARTAKVRLTRRRPAPAKPPAGR
ncbi:MAG TPA: IPT/TIG domain-containing protein [Solirubrobacteraceae bacterium]|jgi:hypothetical protein|nr:IPT/TIG domain-containing protein [Solirubrobacteraceae bacterium]